MAKYTKWIAGGLGWAFLGPIGGILGYIFGSMLENIPQENDLNTHSGDFNVSLLILAAAVIKADKKILQSELDYVKSYFIRVFGQTAAVQYMQLLGDILKQDISVSEVCLQIKHYMEYESRLQLLHFLFGIAASDNDIDPYPTNRVQVI